MESSEKKCRGIASIATVGAEYDIALDIGTGSVGWSVTDVNGKLFKRKGKNAWGSRLFETASTAADTRSKRTLRRRYDRRKQRIYNLREIMASDVAAIDPDFFAKFNQFPLIGEDRTVVDNHILFDDESYSALFLRNPEETHPEKKYPTIYHLRKRLVEDSSQEDIRLVYLALHHLVKYRGNFLIEGELTAQSADGAAALEGFAAALFDYCEGCNISFNDEALNVDQLNAIVTDSVNSRRERQEAFASKLMECFEKESKDFVKALSQAVFGYQVAWEKIFEVEPGADAKFSLDNDEKVTKFTDEILPEECGDLFECIQAIHNAYLLAGILKGAAGSTLSASMVNIYEQHSADLSWLKQVVKAHAKVNPETSTKPDYNNMFRGPKYADGTYIKKSAKGYTGYILGQVSQEDFYKQIKSTIGAYALSDEENVYWQDAQKRIEDGTFLRKLRTSDNGAIPHQLHLEELRAIVKNQGEYYPTLKENAQHIEQILTFRIPYYVGPLGKNKNPNRDKPFGWAKRRQGQENTQIKPWNIEQVIDFDQAAEDFITNLTGECSYYYGMPVIPKYSLLYSEFCVRQELNKCRVATDSENYTLMDVKTVESIYQNVFKCHARVKVDMVREYLKSIHITNTAFKGTQKDGEFASSLKSYCDFRKILQRDFDSFEDYEMVEQLILWVTVFEDKKILQRKINQTYGPEGSAALTSDQVKRICRLRYTGWSNLSREFLTELKVECDGRKLSIMGALRDGGRLRPMNLMEILADEKFGFKALLDEKNKEYLNAHQGFMLEDIPGSPAIKRGINQSLRIVDEIAAIAGKPPRRIIVEMAREDVGAGKGRRTTPREKRLQELYANLQNDILLEDSGVLDKQLKSYSDKLDNDRLFLYFMQRGKCLYCGKPFEIENLNDYHIDHIVPQSMIKDDSFDNRVLVCRHCNETKLDHYPLPHEMRNSSATKRWRALKDAGLISAKKFNSLMQTEGDDRRLDGMARGFINRQLVETRQISKHVVTLLQAKYPESAVETVKAALSHQLRETYELPKVREVNDWHHAHDAYLAAQISRFIHERFESIGEDLTYSKFSKYAYAVKNKQQSDTGLIINSFKFQGTDAGGEGVFADAWDGPAEIQRLHEVLNYKDCFVSRKLERLTGEFWNQTVYSPRDKSAKAIPLKKEKNPEVYGYYSSFNSAYYALIEYVDNSKKKPKTKREMVGIPVDVSYRIDNQEDLTTMTSYLESRFDQVKVLRAPIYKYQKIEWDGAQYYLTSPSEMINARQLWLPHDYVLYLQAAQNALRDGARYSEKKIFNDWPNKQSMNAAIFVYLREQINNYYPRYGGVYEKLTADKTIEKFDKMTVSDQVLALFELLRMLHCDGARGLVVLGLGNRVGRMDGVNSSSEGIKFINTSVTGMFES